MARGRELVAQKVTGQQRNDLRWKEVADGKLSLPREPRTLYVLNRQRLRRRQWKGDRLLPPLGHLCALRHAGIHRTIHQGERQRSVAHVPWNRGRSHHDQPAQEVRPTKLQMAEAVLYAGYCLV